MFRSILKIKFTPGSVFDLFLNAYFKYCEVRILSKYVVKGLDTNSDVVISIVCPVDDIPNIIDAVNANKAVKNVRVTYLDPEYNKE